jgi:CheY-like chemotaxis protein
MPIEVLLVEDNPAEARLLEEIDGGSSVPVNITIAKNCSGALAILDEGRTSPNVVIADMGVLEFGGFELLKRCKPREIPVVIFSGSVNPADETRAMKLGANEFVAKPIHLDDYVEAVWKIIGKWARLDSATAGRNG